MPRRSNHTTGLRVEQLEERHCPSGIGIDTHLDFSGAAIGALTASSLTLDHPVIANRLGSFSGTAQTPDRSGRRDTETDYNSASRSLDVKKWVGDVDVANLAVHPP